MIYQNKNLKKKVPSPCSLSDRQEEGVPGPHAALAPSFTGNGEGTTTTERTLRLMSASLRLLLRRGSPRCTTVVRISYRPRDGSATGRLGRGGVFQMAYPMPFNSLASTEVLNGLERELGINIPTVFLKLNKSMFVSN